MEPNKLEKQFKKQLNAREIQPAEMAWNKLDAMLAVADQSVSKQRRQKSKSKFSWLYVAASFVGFLLLGTVYFSQNDNSIEKEKKEVVLENTVAPEINKEPETISTPVQETEKKLVAIVLSKINSGRSKLSVIKEKSNVVTDNSCQNQAVEVSINHLLKGNTASGNSIQEKSSTSINKYISAEKLLAEVTNTKLESKSIDKSANKTSTMIAVNPNILLQNAETELNQSFRESALNRLNKNFKTIKTVLANRNYEE